MYKRTKVNNLIKKIESKTSLIPRKRIEEIILFHDEIKGTGIKFNYTKPLAIADLSYNLIFERYFKDTNRFKEIVEKKILEDSDEMLDENSAVYDKIVEIIEKLDREYGLSLNDLEELNLVLDRFH